MAIRYTTAPTPLGILLIAATERGVCTVAFGDHDVELEQALGRDFPNTPAHRERNGLAAGAESIIAYLNGECRTLSFPLDVRGTAFQRRVWQALQDVPYGETRAYGEIAKSIGRPDAVRAVAAACAANRAALVIPCHRALGKDGALTGYRWGIDRKRRLIALEVQSSRFKVGDMEIGGKT